MVGGRDRVRLSLVPTRAAFWTTLTVLSARIRVGFLQKGYRSKHSTQYLACPLVPMPMPVPHTTGDTVASPGCGVWVSVRSRPNEAWVQFQLAPPAYPVP